MPDQVDWRALEREASPGRAVGRLLRDQREARGLGLSEIEKSLRIRRTNLEAIEEGRFDKLPGAAYIPAFLRAYAAHVGLDPEKVLTAYHLSGPVPIKRPLTLPADFPIVEKRAPIGLAVLTVLLVVGAGYAAWHYLPREQAVVAEKVPPVPDRLLASRPAPSSPTDAATSRLPRRLLRRRRPPHRRRPPRRCAARLPPCPPKHGRRGATALRRRRSRKPRPRRLRRRSSLPSCPAAGRRPPPVVTAIPAIGQAQAAQPPAPVDQPRVTTQQPPARLLPSRKPWRAALPPMRRPQTFR